MNALSLLAGRFPRLSLLVYWTIRPARLAAAYSGHRTWPILGLVFQPRTTLQYVLPGTAAHHRTTDWLSVGIGVLGDVAGLAHRAGGSPARPAQSDSPRRT